MGHSSHTRNASHGAVTIPLARRTTRIGRVAAAVVSDTVPRGSVASVMGIGGAAGAIGGMIMAQYVGHALESFGSYWPVFVWASSAYLIALLILHLLLPRIGEAEAGAETGPGPAVV